MFVSGVAVVAVPVPSIARRRLCFGIRGGRMNSDSGTSLGRALTAFAVQHSSVHAVGLQSTVRLCSLRLLV